MISLPQAVLERTTDTSVTRRSCEDSAERGGAAYLQVSDDRWVVVNGFAIDGFPHAFAVERELLHCLLLGKVGPLVEDLPRCLVLETRHVEEPLRGAHVCRHGDNVFTVGQNSRLLAVHKGVVELLTEYPRKDLVRKGKICETSTAPTHTLILHANVVWQLFVYRKKIFVLEATAGSSQNKSNWPTLTLGQDLQHSSIKSCTTRKSPISTSEHKAKIGNKHMDMKLYLC